ncbi:hypothetical protein CFP65_0769 [Kitasatospora sp. MMS16-BH015]|uniref:condensation domain-containing protein n=1 Tax=Kitasatospora sp. MMS16-BH015 TaxID=2018025 RepID=UPI000CA0EF54|nr:condensation domain-containing protein [Kitasatospora sp. MMS16-BH015]AUG75718.1 hypothetical protein CFP65_0769 [Kitasatospora sp. MMS16-BH015]
MTVPDTPSVLPLTPQQRGLYFLHRLAPHSAVYHVPIMLRVRGALDLDRLAEALDLLRTRHQALRLTVEERAGEPVQLIHSAATAPPVPLARRAAPSLAAATAEAVRLAALPFDPARGPLWRAAALRLTSADHVLALSFHHLLIDEVSATALAAELHRAYADPAALDPAGPEHRYQDFCAALSAAPASTAMAYWRRRLADLPALHLPARRLPALHFPAEQLADPSGPFTGDRVGFTVPTEVAERLTALCRAHRVSEFMVFHAVLLVLMHHWTGSTDLAVGTPMAGRTDQRYAQTIGFFQNTVVLRQPLSPELTFAELLKACRRTVLEALQHESAPFQAVVEATRPAREASRNPLFQVALVFNRRKVEQDWTLPGLTVEPLPFDWPTSHFDLTLTMVHELDALTGDFAFSTQRLTRATATQLATAYPALLAALCAAPETPVAKAAPGLPRNPRPAPGPAAPTTPPATPPQGETELRLAALFEEILGIPGLTRHDSFFDYGGHSLLAVRLIGRVVAELQLPITLSTFMHDPTIAGLAEAARAATASPLVRLRPTTDPDAGTALVLLHPVGGTLLCYAELLRHLPPELEVLGLERIPGAHPTDADYRSLVDRYARAIAEALPHRPVALCGWSLGGLLAHSVGARLRELGHPVALVSLLDSLAPRTPAEADQLSAAAAELRTFAADLLHTGRITSTPLLLHGLGVRLEELRRTPPEQAALLLADWADLLALAAHHAPEPTDVPVQLVLCADSASALRASWSGLHGGPLELRTVPGTHTELLSSPAVELVAATLTERLTHP